MDKTPWEITTGVRMAVKLDVVLGQVSSNYVLPVKLLLNLETFMDYVQYNTR